MGHLERSIVDQDVDAPERLHRVIHDGRTLRQVPQISRQQQALAPGRLDPARSLFCVLVFVQV